MKKVTQISFRLASRHTKELEAERERLGGHSLHEVARLIVEEKLDDKERFQVHAKLDEITKTLTNADRMNGHAAGDPGLVARLERLERGLSALVRQLTPAIDELEGLAELKHSVQTLLGNIE
jgi:hypothetical protein